MDTKLVILLTMCLLFTHVCMYPNVAITKSLLDNLSTTVLYYAYHYNSMRHTNLSFMGYTIICDSVESRVNNIARAPSRLEHLFVIFS